MDTRKSDDPSSANADVPEKNGAKSDDPAYAEVPDKNAGQSGDVTTPAVPITSREEVPRKFGKDVLEEKKYSGEVNGFISRRWTGIIKKGLPEQERNDTVALYPIPDNNRLWDPPKLNPEVKGALQDQAVLRDSS